MASSFLALRAFITARLVRIVADVLIFEGF